MNRASRMLHGRTPSATKLRRWAHSVLLASATVLAGDAAMAVPLGAQDVHPELAPLERLIGGSWHLGEDSHQSFSWGVGRQSVKSEMHFVTPDGTALVAELTFLYHPGLEAVKGYGVAVDMGVDFFEYTVHFEGDTIVLDLEAFGPAAGDAVQRETWVFTDDDRYLWTLYEQSEAGWERTMGGTFERRRSP